MTTEQDVAAAFGVAVATTLQLVVSALAIPAQKLGQALDELAEAAAQVRFCAHCGAPLVRKVSPVTGKIERLSRFEERRYCGRDCGRRAKRGPRASTAAAKVAGSGPVELRAPHEPIRMVALGEPCPHHPSYTINAWGQCAACVTGDRWAARQREIKLRPHPEGGR